MRNQELDKEEEDIYLSREAKIYQMEVTKTSIYSCRKLAFQLAFIYLPVHFSDRELPLAPTRDMFIHRLNIHVKESKVAVLKRKNKVKIQLK